MTDVRDPDVIRRDIAQTRQVLGEAVEELAAKTDVKARGREKLSQMRHAAANVPQRSRAHPGVTAAVAAVAVALVVLVARR